MIIIIVTMNLILIIMTIMIISKRSEEWATYMHRHLLDPDPLQVEGGWEALAPAIPTGVMDLLLRLLLL